VELAYNDYANARQRAAMAAEFYGKTFSVFKVRCCVLVDRWAGILPKGHTTGGASPNWCLYLGGSNPLTLSHFPRGSSAQTCTLPREDLAPDLCISLGGSRPDSNTCFSGLTRVQPFYAISIESAVLAQSNSSIHYYECIALCKDIGLQRGRFCTRSLVSYIPRSSKVRSS